MIYLNIDLKGKMHINSYFNFLYASEYLLQYLTNAEKVDIYVFCFKSSIYYGSILFSNCHDQGCEPIPGN